MGCANCAYCVENLRDNNNKLCVACTKIPSNDSAGCGYMIINDIDYFKERMWFCPFNDQLSKGKLNDCI